MTDEIKIPEVVNASRGNEANIVQNIRKETSLLTEGHAIVSAWLKEQGFDMYIENFRLANITPSEIPYIDDKHLKEIGVTLVGHRIRLLGALKKFKRALKNVQRNEAQMHLRNWTLRPTCCVFFPRTFDLTTSAIIVHIPHPFECKMVTEQVDISDLLDINMREWFGFLGYIDIKSKDLRLPDITIKLRLPLARETFVALKNLWEEDQMRLGFRGKGN
jgi:hypothetical protein